MLYEIYREKLSPLILNNFNLIGSIKGKIFGCGFLALFFTAGVEREWCRFGVSHGFRGSKETPPPPHELESQGKDSRPKMAP
jgi:hypothetical protein